MGTDADVGVERPNDELDDAESEPEVLAEEALERTVLHQDLEIREERFDEENVARGAAEPREVAHTVDEFLCSRCHLWRNRAQLVETGRLVCRECAKG